MRRCGRPSISHGTDRYPSILQSEIQPKYRCDTRLAYTRCNDPGTDSAEEGLYDAGAHVDMIEWTRSIPLVLKKQRKKNTKSDSTDTWSLGSSYLTACSSRPRTIAYMDGTTTLHTASFFAHLPLSVYLLHTTMDSITGICFLYLLGMYTTPCAALRLDSIVMTYHHPNSQEQRSKMAGGRLHFCLAIHA